MTPEQRGQTTDTPAGSAAEPPGAFAQADASALLLALPDPLVLAHTGGEVRLNAAAHEHLSPLGSVQDWRGLFHPDSTQQVVAAMQQAWQGHTAHLSVRLQGSVAPGLLTVAPAGPGWAWLHLRASRDPLEVAMELTDGLGLGMSVQDSHTRILHANDAAQRIMGLSLEQMTGRDSHDPRWQTTGPDGLPLRAEQFPSLRALNTGQVQRDVLLRTFHPPSDSWRWLRVTSIPRRAPGAERPEQVTTIFADVTDFEHANQELRRSEQRYRSLVEASAQIVWDTRPDGSFHPPQPGWEAFTGQTPAEYVGGGWLNAIHPDDQARTLHDWTAAVAGRSVYQTQHRLRRHDGVYVPMQVRAVPVQDEQGQVQEYVGTHTDISALREAQLTLSRLNAELEQRVQARTQELDDATRFSGLLLSSAGEGIFGVDLAGRATFANPAVAHMLGYTPQELIGSDKHALIHHHHADGTPYRREDSPVYQTLQDGVPRRVDSDVLWHRQGHAIPVEYIVTPLHSQAGQVSGAVVMVQDITERQRAQQALRDAIADLERSNKELEQFAYVASHDLQEPLRTLGSYTELLARRYQEQLDERADQYIAFIQAAVQRMGSLIQDLLAFSRVGRREDLPQEVFLNDLMQQAAQNLQATLTGSGGNLRWDTPHRVYGQPSLLLQLLTNLIGNALKFVAPGVPPQVTVRSERESGDIHLTVQDNGIGIAPEYQERVFDIFQRLNQRESYAGNGMGLAICRKIVESHGGKLWVESNPTERASGGSTFHILLPAIPTP